MNIDTLAGEVKSPSGRRLHSGVGAKVERALAEAATHEAEGRLQSCSSSYQPEVTLTLHRAHVLSPAGPETSAVRGLC